MTEVQIKLGCLLLQEYFGDIVKNVAKSILQTGSLTLKEIIYETKETQKSVKNALRVLIKQNLVTFEMNTRGIVNYKIHAEDLLFMLHYPEFINIARRKFGDEGFFIIRELLHQGQLTSKDIFALKNKIVTEESLKEKFNQLVKMKFIQRCPAVVLGKNSSPLVPTFENRQELLHIVEDDLSDTEETPAKRMRFDEEQHKKQKIYWRVNFERFQLQMRDDAIIQAVANRIDSQAAKIVDIFLSLSAERTDPWSSLSHASSKLELIRNLDDDFNLDLLEFYLMVLVEDSMQILSKTGDQQGGVYSVKVGTVLINIAWTMAEKIVEERLSSKHCRIFRLLRLKKHLEQKEIETMAMIPPKDAKELTYTLLAQNLIQFQEIPQTPDYAPSRNFYLFCIRFLQVMRMLLGWCYQGYSNSVLRRDHETKQNRRLLDKKQHVDSILENFKAQENVDEKQIEEIQEIMTPPECNQLKEFQRAIDKLEKGELRLVNCISIFQMGIKYYFLEVNS